MVVAVDYLLHGATFFACTDGHGHTVLIGTADEEDFLLAQAEIAHIDVGRNVNTSQVTDVYTAVGIGKGGSDESSIENLIIHCQGYLLQSYAFLSQ